ncbi:MAG: smalltalk protein [Prevotella sp.]|nr:smalltalk protein [Prevotella sp.]MBQ8702302.1 smalltalk protein [Prevotella sp.]
MNNNGNSQFWKTALQIALSILTALATAMGMQACSL